MEELKTVGTAEASNPVGAYKTILKSREFSLITDEPKEIGGNDEGPSPGDFICMSLAGCKAITMRMYSQRKQWETGEIDVNVTLVKSNATSVLVHTFKCEISFAKNVSIEQKERLLQIAKACPISKLLSNGADVVDEITSRDNLY